MLIEFSVSNFRSFREKQTFSMVAAQRLKKKDCVVKPDVIGEKLPDLLKVAVIYGPNASGKSNLLSAFDVVQRIIRLKPSAEQLKLPVSSFRFDKELVDKPSRFEVHFIQNRQRYHFELALTSMRIIEERLTAYPSGVETLLYERLYDESGKTYSYVMGDKLEGGLALHKAWQDLTGSQVLFISQAVANSSEALNQLRAPLNWFIQEFTVFDETDLNPMLRILEVMGSASSKIGTRLSTFLSGIDIPVTDIVFESDYSDTSTTPTLGDFKNFPTDLSQLMSSKVKRITTLTHATALGNADFDISEESKGTKNLMAFFLPIAVMSKHIIIVDELDTSLHPLIVEDLVKKHLTTGGTGQLLFTAHDTHLMDTRLLRRDQFWLTERNANGATRLRSIHDFNGRESEDIEKRYFEGCYRALPIVMTDKVSNE